MSLDGFEQIEPIKRFPYEDQRYSDDELVYFRGLYNLSLDMSSEGRNQFNEEIYILQKKDTLPKFHEYVKDANRHVDSLFAKRAELKARIEELEALEKKHLEEIEKNKAIMADREKTLLLQYNAERDNQLQQTLPDPSEVCDIDMTTPSVVKTSYK